MAKQTRQTKAVSIHSQGKGAQIEHSESYDDSLLPDAEELTKLKILDPNIMDWVKSRTEKEQDARLEFNKNKIGLLQTDQKRNFIIDIITVLCSFIIILSAMFFSGLLIYLKCTITGTIFAGVTIVIVVTAFLNFIKIIPKTNINQTNKIG